MVVVVGVVSAQAVWYQLNSGITRSSSAINGHSSEFNASFEFPFEIFGSDWFAPVLGVFSPPRSFVLLDTGYFTVFREVVPVQDLARF